MRLPKLLQPRPTTLASSDPIRLVSTPSSSRFVRAPPSSRHRGKMIKGRTAQARAARPGARAAHATRYALHFGDLEPDAPSPPPMPFHRPLAAALLAPLLACT